MAFGKRAKRLTIYVIARHLTLGAALDFFWDLFHFTYFLSPMVGCIVYKKASQHICSSVVRDKFSVGFVIQ
jgi:hypothetical protein